MSGTHHPPGEQKYMGWFFCEKQSPLHSRRVGVVTLIDTMVHFDKNLSGAYTTHILSRIFQSNHFLWAKSDSQGNEIKSFTVYQYF